MVVGAAAAIEWQICCVTAVPTTPYDTMENRPPVAPLEYRIPSPPISASRVFFGTASVACAIIALLASAGGLLGVVRYFFQEDREFSGPEFLYIPAAIALAGIGFSFLALRWGRRALGRERRGNGG